jgi:hypothetical protein
LRVPALDRVLEAERALIGRARLLLDIVITPLPGGATARRTTQTPRRPNGAGGARGASRLRRLSVRDHQSCSVYDRSRVQNRVGPSGFESYDPPCCDSMLAMLSAFRAKDRLLKPTLAGAANPFDAACMRRVSAIRLALPQTKLSRNSNQVARGRIRRFESDMPSHAVVRHLGTVEPPDERSAKAAAVAQLDLDEEGLAQADQYSHSVPTPIVDRPSAPTSPCTRRRRVTSISIETALCSGVAPVLTPTLTLSEI